MGRGPCNLYSNEIVSQKKQPFPEVFLTLGFQDAKSKYTMAIKIQLLFCLETNRRDCRDEINT